MYMIKSNGGDGNVDNVLLENFIGKNYISRPGKGFKELI